MKRFFILALIAVFAVLGCSDHKPSKVTLAPEVLYVDSLRYMVGGDDYPAELSADSLRGVWDKFAVLYSKGEYQKAYDYLFDDGSPKAYGDITLYLRNSTACYAFISRLVRPILKSVSETEQDFYEQMLSLVEFNFTMTQYIVEIGRNESEYVPPHYLDVATDLSQYLMIVGNFDQALEFVDTYYQVYLDCGVNKVEAKMLTLFYKALILASDGRAPEAFKLLSDYEAEVKAEGDEETLEIVSAMIGPIRDVIKERLVEE